MKRADYWLQERRFVAASHYLPHGSRLLDIGSADGALARRLSTIKGYVGIDPCADESVILPSGGLIRGVFPRDMPPCDPFDAISLLAVLEHIPVEEQSAFVAACWQYLLPGGRIVITVPSPTVDWILFPLRHLGAIDGMHLDEHFGFKPLQTPSIFSAPAFELLHHRRFELGLNHLFVFAKRSEPACVHF